MKDKTHSWQSRQLHHQELFFRLINPGDYSRLGIDPQDVPMGTFAAEDHPSFLPSRYGGNAYGLGLIEQSVLSKADTDFLESIDFQNVLQLGQHTSRLNAIYQKLGLLIRFSHIGKRYFLIPINLVAHSLRDIKAKADEIEELIFQHGEETGSERLDIGLLTGDHDLIVHELTARLSSHRIFIFESMEKLRSWRLSLDIIILPKDIFEYLLEQPLPKVSGRSLNRRHLNDYALYLSGKIYDLLKADGKLVVLSHAPGPQGDTTCRVVFKSEEELKFFLLFSHVYKTRQQYEGNADLSPMRVHLSDLHYYMNRLTFPESHVKRLINDQKPEELTVDEINRLPHLNLRLPQDSMKSLEKQWKRIFEPYFTIKQIKRQSTKQQHQFWQDRLEADCELPESLSVLVGKVRQPTVTLEALEEELKASGMQGCSLPLVAEYRNTFRYVLNVLKTLIRIRDHDFPKLSELERARLSNPFRVRSESFSGLARLLDQIDRIEKIRQVLNPHHIEGQTTSVLQNIPKLSLHGFSPAQLREILLIVVGHTTMSRIIFGKLPAKTLEPITDKAKEGNYQEILNLLRICRLMSMGEIAAALGDAFTGEQARELYRLYDDAIYVATDPSLTWDKLNDLRISALGGVQNRAVREMLKFFNLFEFLDNWHEFIHKGPSEKEVICDYEPEKLSHLEEALELARTAGHFKQKFLGDYIFGQSYFFRQFLNTEFHGTGHLFPRLGTKAGFILLWITVNASTKHIINFNPMLAGVSEDRQEQRVTKMKEILLRIPTEQLHPRFFEEIKKTLDEGRPAFIFDSGIRMMNNPETRAMDVSFVDVDENIQQIEALLTHLEAQELRAISLRNLQNMERLFSELESFHHYLSEQGCRLDCDTFQAGGLEVKGREIESIKHRLKETLQSQIFIPEEIHDTLSVLAKHCPEILRFILPEFHALGNLVENWPARQKQSLGSYVMRCIEKFQALIVKDRNTFQDRNTFYQLAKQEFGAFAEEGIGATYAQIETLEYLVDRIQQKPMLCQALTLAMLFQEIGKMDPYSKDLGQDNACRTHAEVGAVILEKREILQRYHLDAQVERLVIGLVRFHGLIGHVIQGEEPVTALEKLTADQDDRLLDAFVLHAVLAAAAVQEGLMVADLLDTFLSFRTIALEVIKSKSHWRAWLRESFREKGEAALADSSLSTREIHALFAESLSDCSVADGKARDVADSDVSDEALLRGRWIYAMERLLKLMGVMWVDYQDLQMVLMNVPVNFIYHKKKLKSVGLSTFDKQLRSALRIDGLISDLTPEVRCYLLHCLDHLGAGLRIYHFHPLYRFLDLEDCLKLLLIALRAFHHRFGAGANNGLISFRPLSQTIERKHGALQVMLKDIPLPGSCTNGAESIFKPQRFGGFHIQVDADNRAISIGYQDAIQLDEMICSLRSQWSHDALTRCHDSLISDLRRELPYDAGDLEEQLKKAFEQQQAKINDLVLKELQERLNRAVDFSGFQKIQNEMQREQAELNFTDEQRFLLKEMFEFHRSRLREHYLDSIYRQLSTFSSKDALSSYWNTLKYELFSYRSYVGKEYESLIAEFIDQKMKELEH